MTNYKKKVNVKTNTKNIEIKDKKPKQNLTNVSRPKKYENRDSLGLEDLAF